MSQSELKFLFFTSIKFLWNLVPLRAGVDSAPPVIPVYFYWDPPTDLSLSSLSVSCKQESVENMTRLAFHMDKPRNLEFGLYTLDTFFYSGGVFRASIWSTYVPLKLSPSRRKRLMGGGQQDFRFGSLTLHCTGTWTRACQKWGAIVSSSRRIMMELLVWQIGFITQHVTRVTQTSQSHVFVTGQLLALQADNKGVSSHYRAGNFANLSQRLGYIRTCVHLAS